MKIKLLTTISAMAMLFATTTAQAAFPICEPLDPLLIDLGQDGFHFGPKGVGVDFDLLGIGQSIHMQWVATGGNDAFLIADNNANGIVDDGSELFGNGTRLILESDSRAPNGFVGLAQYDDPQLGGNNDGYINQDDEIWPVLGLWLDKNADGISTADEMINLDEFGITRIGIIPRQHNRYDSAGNWMPLWSWTKNENVRGKSKYKMVDVIFKQLL
jgi:hypothetical protein